MVLQNQLRMNRERTSDSVMFSSWPGVRILEYVLKDPLGGQDKVGAGAELVLVVLMEMTFIESRTIPEKFSIM